MGFSLEPLLLALIPALLFGIETFFLTKANRTMEAFRVQFIFQLIGIPLLLVILPFISPERNGNLPLIIGLGVGETFVFTLYFYALRIGKLAIVGTILQTYIVVTVFLAVVFLHESFSFFKFIAIAAVVVGIIFLGFHLQDLRKTKKVNLFVGVVPALIAALGTGVYFFFVGISSRANGWYSTALGIRIMIPLTIVIVFLFQRKKLTLLFKDIAWKWILPGVICDVLAFSIYNYAFTRYEVSYVTVIGASAPIVSTVLAILYLKEKLTLFQLVGFILVIVGVICLNLV